MDSTLFFLFTSVIVLNVSVLTKTEVFNITGGVGKYKNLTLYVVDDSVTWYTAKEICAQEIPGSTFDMCGGECTRYVIQTIAERMYDVMIWVGMIKSGEDNIVYSANGMCTTNTALTRYVMGHERLNTETQCLLLNTSNMAIGLDNCFEKHPYMCYRRDPISNSISEFNTSLEIFYNVTVSFDDNTAQHTLLENSTLDDCISGSNCGFSCIAKQYFIDEQLCYKLSDISGNWDAAQTLSLTTNDSEQTVLAVKLAKRAFLEYKKPNISKSDHEGPIYTCGSSQTTDSASQPIMCECQICPHQINSSDLQNWINEMKITLTVDKGELSSTIRKLNSAEDIRTSSKAIGSVSTIFLVFVVLLVTSGDIITLCIYMRCVFLPKIIDKLGK